LLVCLFVLIPLGYAYVGTHVARPPVDDIDLGSTAVEQVELRTSDGLNLEGSYVPSKNGAAVIVAFGRKGTQAPARLLARHGYGVLIFDRRDEGESDGDPNPYAWTEGERDLLAAIEFLKGRPDVEAGRIGGVGLSVGGETFLQAAAHSEDLQAVVSEGATASSVGELLSVPGSQSRSP
jgi:predicted alpha/beta hydrolase